MVNSSTIEQADRGVMPRSGDDEGSAVVSSQPRSIELAAKSIGSGREFEDFMKALMCDVVLGYVPSKSAHAAAALGRNLLKAVDLRLRYGTDVIGPD